MNEVSQESNAESSTEPVAGERLAAARRARAISVHEIAKELHLDEPKVRALEENRFDDFGAPVFAKGHMRKYAELVGVSTEDVLEDYYKLNRSTGAPPVVGAKRRPPRDLSVGPWLVVTVAVVAAGAAAWWWFDRDTSEPPAQVRPATTPPPVVVAPETVSVAEPDTEQPDQLPSEQPSEQPSGQPSEQPTEAAPASVVAAEDTSVPVEAPADDIVESGPQVDIELVFTGDCWTEITDAHGRRLFYDLGTAGRVISLRGAAPLHVVLGDSENVSIAVGGRDYAISPADRRGRLARLTIDSQG